MKYTEEAAQKLREQGVEEYILRCWKRFDEIPDKYVVTPPQPLIEQTEELEEESQEEIEARAKRQSDWQHILSILRCGMIKMAPIFRAVEITTRKERLMNTALKPNDAEIAALWSELNNLRRLAKKTLAALRAVHTTPGQAATIRSFIGHSAIKKSELIGRDPLTWKLTSDWEQGKGQLDDIRQRLTAAVEAFLDEISL